MLQVMGMRVFKMYEGYRPVTEIGLYCTIWNENIAGSFAGESGLGVSWYSTVQYERPSIH